MRPLRVFFIRRKFGLTNFPYTSMVEHKPWLGNVLCQLGCFREYPLGGVGGVCYFSCPSLRFSALVLACDVKHLAGCVLKISNFSRKFSFLF